MYRGRYVPQRDVFQEAKRGVNFRPQEDHRQQGNQHQDGAYQSQGLGTDGIQIQLDFVSFRRAFCAVDMVWLFLATRTLGEDLCPSVLGTVERQTAALDQHPAAYHVIHHQKQEPDRHRGFKPRQQRLGGRQVTHRRCQHGNQRCAQQQVPEQPVEHVVAVTGFIQIERDTGAFQAERDNCQRPAYQHKAEAAQRP